MQRAGYTIKGDEWTPVAYAACVRWLCAQGGHAYALSTSRHLEAAGSGPRSCMNRLSSWFAASVRVFNRPGRAPGTVRPSESSMRAAGIAPWVLFYRAEKGLADALLEQGPTWWAWDEPHLLADLGFRGREGLVRAFSNANEQLAHLVLSPSEKQRIERDFGISLEAVYEVTEADPELATPWPNWRELDVERPPF